MQPRITIELGVKCAGELIALARADDAVVDLCQNAYPVANGDDSRCTDKRHRRLSESLDLGDCMETTELSAVGVALDFDIHGSEARRPLVIVGGQALGEQDRTGAGRENGHAAVDAFLERFEHSKLVEQLALCGRLSAGEYEPVERLLKVRCLTELYAGFAELHKTLLMFDKCALNCENCGWH